MDPTLAAILRALYQAHAEVDTLRAKVAELEAALTAVKDKTTPPEQPAAKGKAA